MLRAIERRFAQAAGGGFTTAVIAFDPANDRGRDLTRKGARRKPVPVFGLENGRRVRLNRDEPPGEWINPRAALPAVMFEPVRGRAGGT
jgi:hypothetical protein